MDFSFTEEQKAIQNMAQQFAEERIAPHALEWDEDRKLPVDVLREAAELGMGGIYVSEDAGGSGLDRIDAALIFEALAMGDPSISSFLSIHNMCAWMVDHFGDDSPHGISTLIVPKDTQGLSFGAQEKKMGWNAQPTSMVYFENVHVPVANRIGAEGDGFKFAMAGLDGGRVNIAACSLGAAQSALDKALAYIHERHAFGKQLAEFQALQFKIADMETELQAARIFLYQAAWKLSNNVADATKYSAMAKRLVTDVGFNVANEALQLHGGYGYLTEYGIEKIVRDLRVHQILEGTNEIMRVIISRAMLGRNAS